MPHDDIEGGANQSLLSGGSQNGYGTENGNHRNQFTKKVNKAFKHSCRKTKRLLFDNHVNIMVVLVPVGILSGLLGWSPTAIFVLNFLAIIPLASLLSTATEQLSMEVGDTLGGLMNATFGNAVELIVSVIALTKGEIRVVQASMLGSILSNLLLVNFHRISARAYQLTTASRRCSECASSLVA
jgi:Ca2+:H+ antiporter